MTQYNIFFLFVFFCLFIVDNDKGSMTIVLQPFIMTNKKSKATTHYDNEINSTKIFI